MWPSLRVRLGAFALLAFSMAALAATYVPPPDFRGYAWGKAQGEFPKLVADGSDSDVQLYVLPGTDLTIGQATVDFVQFGFYKQRFSNVIVRFQGDGNAIGILAALKAKYGDGLKPNQYIDNYYWGLNTDVSISYKYSDVSKKGSLIYSYQPLMDEMNKDDAAAAKKAAGQI